MTDTSDLEKLLGANVKATLTPRLEGPVDQLVYPMTKMGIFPDYSDESPGISDDIQKALSTPSAMLYGVNAKGGPRFKKWYESGEDLGVVPVSSDYLAFWIRLFGEAGAAKERAKTKAENIIKNIYKQHPIEYETAKKMIQHEYEHKAWETVKYLKDKLRESKKNGNKINSDDIVNELFKFSPGS